MSSGIEAFELLYRRYRAGLSSFANSIINSSGDAEEIVNDVFLSIWDKRDHLVLDDGLKNYLFTAVKNRCLNYIKKAKLPFSDMPEEFTPVSSAHGPDRDLEGREMQAFVTRIIDELPPKCKQVFLLSRMFDLSYKEISEIMDISPKTVENQIGIALKHLKHRTGRPQIS